jgi:hypothetical protein
MAGIDATQLSIYQPVGDREILVRRFLTVPAAQQSYIAACKVAIGILEGLAPEIDQLAKIVAPVKLLDDKTLLPGGPGGPGGFSNPASVSASNNSVFVVSGNRLLKFSEDGLKLQTSTELPAVEAGGFPGGPFGGPSGPGGPGGPGGFGRNVSLNDFIKQRIAQVKLQLDGKAQGQTPRSMGPGGPGRP